MTTTFNMQLRNVRITDTVGIPAQAPAQTVDVTCPRTTLRPGESMICTASGTSGALPEGSLFAGQYAARQQWRRRTAAARARDSRRSRPPTRRIAPGPCVPVGDQAEFTCVVTNTGDLPVRNVAVTDDQGVVVDCPSGNLIPLLDVGASETCTGSATVTDGQYVNRSLVSAEAPDGTVVDDKDLSHHRGGGGQAAGIPTMSTLGLALLLGAIGARTARRV